MSLQEFINRTAAQDIVHWQLLSIDAYSRETFAAGQDLKARWTEAQELVVDSKGEERMSIAKALVLQDMSEGDYLWLGAIADSEYDADPKDVDNALRVVAFQKIPELGSADKFIRYAYLNMGRNTTI